MSFNPKASFNKKSSFKTGTKTSLKPPSNCLSDEYKLSIQEHSYIGKKGYTIPKTFISKEDDEQLRVELKVKPMIFGVTYDASEEAFPVFRENTNKMYLPRFYGIERYGMPKFSELSTGETINVRFEKSLRDYQDKIVDIYINYVNKPTTNVLVKGNGGILEVPCGRGKTVMALKIISVLQLKTIIIVHKEFLMNQWIERIAEFLPNARVGKIQGSVFDIENKDIVIGMVQSLYDKDFAPNAFDSFGLTIIDEVHRIGSEQFSRTLCKIITPYMLGISATVDRKDKLTRVLYMFIGKKIYSEEKPDDDLVCVRAVHYSNNDPEFNETELDYRGNTKYSTMIVKLCEYGPRSDFIVRLLGDLILENPEKQIMILCHNRSLLKYLYEAIQYRNIAPVGYYVGGMKQIHLQETETKSIVLATYAMAAEALDIKSLSTLVMVTPKTDIIQSVGRILRSKHANPIVVDIIDAHDVFKKQWVQRKRYYKSCNYCIREIDSTKYVNMGNVDSWKHTFDPNLDKVSNQTKCLLDISLFDDEK